MAEWLEAIERSFPDWEVHISNTVADSEYGHEVMKISERMGRRVHFDEDLHLSVSVRSFRSENVSSLIKAVLDVDRFVAKSLYDEVKENFQIVVTRDLEIGKKWLKEKSRGNERFGLLASS